MQYALSPSETSSFLIIELWQQIGLKSQLQFNSIRGFQDDVENFGLQMSNVDTKSNVTSLVVGFITPSRLVKPLNVVC